jgi:hypothetical protein
MQIEVGKFEGNAGIDIAKAQEAYEIVLDGMQDMQWDLGSEGDVDVYDLVTLRSGEQVIIENDDQGFITLLASSEDKPIPQNAGLIPSLRTIAEWSECLTQLADSRCA